MYQAKKFCENCSGDFIAELNEIKRQKLNTLGHVLTSSIA